MSNPDFMNVLRMCAHCRCTDETVCYSKYMNCYICDSCYTDYNDAKEDKIIASCYPIAE
jgi:hypothetical protein